VRNFYHLVRISIEDPSHAKRSLDRSFGSVGHSDVLRGSFGRFPPEAKVLYSGLLRSGMLCADMCRSELLRDDLCRTDLLRADDFCRSHWPTCGTEE
jgi:hypothetical protein